MPELTRLYHTAEIQDILPVKKTTSGKSRRSDQLTWVWTARLMEKKRTNEQNESLVQQDGNTQAEIMLQPAAPQQQTAILPQQPTEVQEQQQGNNATFRDAFEMPALIQTMLDHVHEVNYLIKEQA